MLLKAKFMSLLNNAAKKSYVVFFKTEDKKFLFTKEVLFEIKSDKIESLIKEFFEVDNLNEDIIYKSNNLYSFNSYSVEKLKKLISTYLESEISKIEETESFKGSEIKNIYYKPDNTLLSKYFHNSKQKFKKRSNEKNIL